MRYLAIDYGKKRTGLAICDFSETVVSPLMVLEKQKHLISKILEAVKEEQVDAVVLGLPLNMDDSYGPQAKIILSFAEQLKRKLHIPIHLQDERLSSFSAEEKLNTANLKPKKKKKRLDAVAAAEILESFLECKNR